MAEAASLICVGHAALDRIYRIDSFPPEPTKIRALEHIESGGGMAANAAVAAARLGARAELWSRVGDDTAGIAIRNGLKAEKVDVRYVHAFEEARSSTSAVMVDSQGERMIVTQRDTSIPAGTSWLPLERIAEANAVLCDLRWLEAVRVVLTRARREGIPTILDADLGGREALPELLGLVDYAVFSAPSLHEFARGMSDDEALQQVLRHGPRHAGVTLGVRGYIWRERDGRAGSQPAFHVDVVDTTGAGDAFHGAFALGIAEGLDTETCVRRAAGVAALKCTRLGSRAGLPTRSELELFVALQGG